MSKIKVKYFGPIKEGYHQNDGWLDIKKVTTFIGNQGTGKSTMAKLISTLTWIEKALVRGDYDKKEFEGHTRLRNHYLSYHRINNYFTESIKSANSTQIEYKGNSYGIVYKDGVWSINKLSEGEYVLPKIMYIPAERNFITNIKDPNVLKLTSNSLIDFLVEFNNAKDDIKDTLILPVNNAVVEYDRLNDILNIKDNRNSYRIRLSDSSSGFQSLVPMYLVSRYLANAVATQNTSRMSTSNELERFRKDLVAIISKEDLTLEQKGVAISALSARFTKGAFINIIEEPEQNLFPISQWEVLKELLALNNLSKGNKLILTTHSPYIINYLSLAIQADYLKNKLKSNKALLDRLAMIVPLDSTVQASDVSIYELLEDGTIIKLPDYEGIPSDNNFLNRTLMEGNRLFDMLLQLEEEIS